jgi:hypothetical protein
MKNNILDIFTIARSLADFVELGLADDQARATQAKATATALKKLIVNFDASALEVPQTVNIGKAMDQLSTTQKVEWEHPTLATGVRFMHPLIIKDVKYGFSNNRNWVKTTCKVHLGGCASTLGDSTLVVVWGQFKSQKDELFGECAEIGETIACKYEVKSSIEAGGKYNKKHHAVTVKVDKEFLTNR